MHEFSGEMVDRSMRLLARALAARRLQTVVAGAGHLPAVGPAVIIARHYHHLFDGLALFAAIPRRFHIVVALDWVRSARAQACMRALTRLARWPVVLRPDALSRRAHAAAHGARLFSPADVVGHQRRALLLATTLLAEGRILVVFPESYPNIDPIYTPKLTPEDFLPFQSGFASIVEAAEKRLGKKLPIVPLGIHYRAGKPWVAHLVFGVAVHRAEFADRADLVEFAQNEVKRLSALAAGSAAAQ